MASCSLTPTALGQVRLLNFAKLLAKYSILRDKTRLAALPGFQRAFSGF